LPLVKIETIRTNKTFKAETAKIFDEEKKISQNIETKNVDIVDLSKNKTSKDNSLKRVVIYYGDFTFKNSALDMVSLLKKEIKNVNPTIIQVNKKFRVKAVTISDINEFDIFFNKIVNTKFENYNISVE
jgi:homoserine trans-succinylase